MSRLTAWLRGENRPPKMAWDYLGHESHPPGTGPSSSGIWIDGAHYELEGQPPVARSEGWGDMSWTRRR